MARLLVLDGSDGGTYTPPDSGSTSTGTTAAAAGPVTAAGTVSSGSVAGGGGVNVSGIMVRVAVADTPVQCQPFKVNKGERVFVRPLPGNTKAIQVGRYSLAAVYGPFDYVGPSDAEREFPVSNTGEIFIAQLTGNFVVNEGVSINIRRAS